MLKAVGVYIFAGGFSLGVRKYFDVLAHCEDEKPYGLEVIHLNRERFWGNMPVLPWPKWEKGLNLCNDIDFVYGNPPCAPFSNNNPISYEPGSWKKDPRIKCWSNIIDFARATQAKVVALETVPQAYNKAPELIIETLKNMSETWLFRYLLFHNIALMGSIQNRNRLFIVGSKVPLCLERHELFYPTETAGTRLELFESTREQSRVYWSLPVAPKYMPIVKATHQGESMRDAFDRVVPEDKRILNKQGKVTGRPSFNIKRLHVGERVNTLCGFAHIHPTEDRYVSVKEYQILADYPVDYEIPEKCEGYGYISRGVSPVAGEWLAKMVSRSLEYNKDREFNPVSQTVLFDGISWGIHPKWGLIHLDKPLPKVKLSRKY